MRFNEGLTTLEVRASTRLAHAIREAIFTTIRDNGLAPMAVFEMGAVALGSVYREAAEMHICTDGCQCGWTPEEGADLESLRTAVAIGAVAIPSTSPNILRPQGRA